MGDTAVTAKSVTFWKAECGHGLVYSERRASQLGWKIYSFTPQLCGGLRISGI